MTNIPKTIPRSTIIYAVIAFLALIVILIVKKDPAGSAGFHHDGFYFDTITRIDIYDRIDERTAEDIFKETDRMLKYYEGLFSRTLETSDVYRINASGGKETAVDPEVIKLLNDALYYEKISSGAVTPLIGSLSLLWNIGSGSDGTVPPKDKIDEALLHVGEDRIKITDTSVTLLDPDAKIDLGFIAKGYIADKVKEYLLSRNIEHAVINLGGNVLTIGERSSGVPFRIGICDPKDPYSSTLLSLECSDEGISSSGDYERYFEKDGIRYHHILSTKTGYPAESGLSQVSIKASSSEEADALSTICFTLGADGSKSVLDKFPDVSAVFVDHDGKVIR